MNQRHLLRNAEPLINTYDVAALTGLAAGSLRNLRCAGRGPRWVRLGRAVRYRPADVEAWINGSVVGTLDSAAA